MPSLLVLLVLVGALSVFLAAINVYARDTQHLLDLALQGMFWAIPVLYEYQRVSNWFVSHGWPAWTPLLNPFTPVVITFQRAIWGNHKLNVSGVTEKVWALPTHSQWWYLGILGIVFLARYQPGRRAG